MKDKELAATVILEAAYTTDDKAAVRYGVSTRSIRRWRKQFASDEVLAAFVRTKKEAMDAAWAEELPIALRHSLDFIASAAQSASDDPMCKRNPEFIHAIAGALRICAEVYYTGKIIDARLANGKDLGDGWPDQIPA